MKPTTCPKCAASNFAGNKTCKTCGENLIFLRGEPDPIMADSNRALVNDYPLKSAPIDQFQPMYIPTVDLGDKTVWELTINDWLQALIWLVALLFFVGFFMTLSADLNRAESSPQQAAAAAMNLGYVVIVYCIARGLSEILKVGKR